MARETGNIDTDSSICPPPTRRRLSEEAMWHAVLNRETLAEQSFVYGVRTTGIYCRPACPARRPLRKNVRFFRSGEEARRAGLRACKRCRPDEVLDSTPHRHLIAAACRWVEEAEARPALQELADRAGLSPFHFHRVFKKATGLTPMQYRRAKLAEKVRTELKDARTVTEAIYQAGYNSAGRFYEKAQEVLGMQPASRQKKGKGERIHFALGECSLGCILVAATERGVCEIALGDEPGPLLRSFQDDFRDAELVGGDRDFERVVARVVALVEAPGMGHDLPLDVRGTSFQQRVWAALRSIPAGQTASYAEVAQTIGAPRSVRAVARACGENRLAVTIPCHRVIRSDGGLSGYRWGVERKRELLRREESA